jgi:hypothetical protein
LTLTRYWHFGDLPPCREGVALAPVRFSLLAFTLLGLYRQETEEEEPATCNMALPPVPMPQRDLAVYAGPYLALLLRSELVQTILAYLDAWKANQERPIMALRLCEGGTRDRCSWPPPARLTNSELRGRIDRHYYQSYPFLPCSPVW